MLSPKYKVGDALFKIKAIPEKAKCEDCLGEGVLFNKKNKSIDCLNCENGFNESGSKWIVYESNFIVRSIAISDKSISYMAGGAFGFSEKLLFLTELEAQKECDRRNNERT